MNKRIKHMKKACNALILILMILAPASCKAQNVKTENENMEENKVTIIGVAKNAKMGAIILTKDQDVYYIDGLHSWDEVVYQKEVKVTGILKLETFKAEDLKNKKGEYKQGIAGDKKTILKPIWEILEK